MPEKGKTILELLAELFGPSQLGNQPQPLGEPPVYQPVQPVQPAPQPAQIPPTPAPLSYSSGLARGWGDLSLAYPVWQEQFWDGATNLQFHEWLKQQNIQNPVMPP